MKILSTASLGTKFTGSYKKRVYSNASQYSGALRLLWNLPPLKQITRNLTILQTKTVKFITCINCHFHLLFWLATLSFMFVADLFSYFQINQVFHVFRKLFWKICPLFGAIHKGCPHIREGGSGKSGQMRTGGGGGWLAKCGRPLGKKL